MRQFADGCRLAGTIDANNKDDVRSVTTIDIQAFGRWCQNIGDIVGEQAAYLVRIDVPFDAPLGQRAGKPCGSGWTKVGGNQDVFQFSNGFRVELPPCEDAGDPVYEPRRRF